MKISIFDYFNYRDYLKDYFRLKKQDVPWFSYRHFAKSAGYNSSGLYINLVSGLRNLTPRYYEGFIKALKLNENEANYFLLMVDYTHAVTDQGRQEIFSRMVSFLPSKEKKIRLNQKEFYSSPLNVMVHQALSIFNVSDDFKILVDSLSPKPTLWDVKKSMKVLQELELIQKTPEGFYKPSHKNMVGGKEIGDLYISNFQSNMVDLGKDAHKRFPTKEFRLQITETISVSKSTAKKIESKVKEMHKEIIQMIISDKEAEEALLQMNLQFFPLINLNPKNEIEQ